MRLHGLRREMLVLGYWSFVVESKIISGEGNVAVIQQKKKNALRVTKPNLTLSSGRVEVCRHAIDRDFVLLVSMVS